MPFVWSMPNIRKLAPDGLTMNRAMGIFFAAKWEEIGGDEQLIWAKYPYYPGRYFKLVIRLNPLKYQCSCRSKAMPCKHILGLLVQLYRNSEVFFISTQPPGWATQLLEPSSIPAPKKKATVSVTSKATEARKKLMDSGVVILQKWLRQLIRQGLAEVQSKPLSYWDEFAAQLADAKLGGVAKKVRSIKAFIQQDEWEGPLLHLIGSLYLFAKAFEQYDDLPLPLAKDLDTYAGISPKRGAVLQADGIPDHWYVLGQISGEEEQLTFRRTWLWGIKSGVPALNLAYSWGGQPYLHTFDMGNIYEATLFFYPSAYPLRAITEEIKPLTNAQHHPKNGYPSIDKFLTHFAQAKALNPFVQNFPVLLHQVVLMMDNKVLSLVDINDAGLELHCEEEVAWQLLAFGGGEWVTFFGEWEEGTLRPLGIWKGERSFFVPALNDKK